MPRKPAALAAAQIEALEASMRPRQRCLGNEVYVFHAQPAEPCFNEAEAKMPRKPRPNSTAPKRARSRFNEAEAKMPRNQISVVEISVPQIRLQ